MLRKSTMTALTALAVLGLAMSNASAKPGPNKIRKVGYEFCRSTEFPSSIHKVVSTFVLAICSRASRRGHCSADPI